MTQPQSPQLARPAAVPAIEPPGAHQEPWQGPCSPGWAAVMNLSVGLAVFAGGAAWRFRRDTAPA